MTTQWPIRVGVSGAPGVGKTTLVHRLEEVFHEKKVCLSTEIARTLAGKGVRINRDSEWEDYLAFLAFHVQRTRTLEGDVILFDRTLLDVLCFMELNGDARGWLGTLVEELVQWQMAHLSRYFYIPPEFEAAPDGVRLIDPLTIGEFDSILRRRLAQFRPDFVGLKGTLDERVERAAREIASLLVAQSTRPGSQSSYV